MKWSFAIVMVWLTVVLSDNAIETPLAVEVNGIATLSVFNCAIFVNDQPMSSVPRSFMLVEGESRFGIKLVAVDAATGCVQIENCGQKQSLHIRTAPDLTTSFVSGTAGTAGYAAKSFVRGGNGANSSIENSDSDDGSIDTATIPGNPGYGTIPLSANTANNTNPGQNSSQSSAPYSNGVDPATAFKDQANAGWYQDSVAIEESRNETAQQVLAGEMTPWPRTPLTPPGTPSSLIGAETFFSNHIPGFHPQ